RPWRGSGLRRTECPPRSPSRSRPPSHRARPRRARTSGSWLRTAGRGRKGWPGGTYGGKSSRALRHSSTVVKGRGARQPGKLPNAPLSRLLLDAAFAAADDHVLDGADRATDGGRVTGLCEREGDGPAGRVVLGRNRDGLGAGGLDVLRVDEGRGAVADAAGGGGLAVERRHAQEADAQDQGIRGDRGLDA